VERVKRETASGLVKTSEVEKIRLLGGYFSHACLGVKMKSLTNELRLSME
jgi:hypothetical protein